MQGRIIGVRVFLEGVEIDVASVGVQGLVGQSATATIEIPSADAVHRLLPRTLVHVFYHENDHRLVDPTNRSSDVVADSSNDQWRENWRLLFAGELVRYRYTNAGGSRQAVLLCQDFSSYWGAARLYWGSNNTSLHSYKQAIAAGASQVYAGKRQINNTNALLNLLQAQPATNPKLTGLLGGLVSLLEAATGVFHPDAKRRFRGVNDFMSQAELRLHLTHMLGVAPNDRTSAKYLGAGQFRQYVRRLARSIGSTSSFADMVNLVLGRIHYSWVSVPAPPYFPKDASQPVKTKVLQVRAAQAIADPHIREDVGVITRLYRYTQDRYAQAQRRYGTAKGDPTKTVDSGGDPLLYLRYLTGATTDAEWDTAGHRDYASNAAVTGFPRSKWWRDRAAQLRGRLTSTTARERFDARIGKGYDWAASAADLLHDRITRSYGNSGYADHTTQNFQTLRSLLEDASGALGGGLGGTRVAVDAEVAVGDRLNAHLFVPDLFMAPPPTCNVLFPDHYTSIQFSRDWLSETTRLLLHTKTASGRDQKNIYFAPNADILAGPDGGDVLNAVKQGASFLMPHELFTGPIVEIEGIGDSTIFRQIHQDVVKSNKKADPKATGAAVSGEALYSPQEHLRRAANHLFFARRFAGRSMVVQARFCPQLVVGLPCMVLDPLLAGRELKDGGVPKGTHFIGTIAALIHHVDARGSATSTIHLVRCREHREGMDLYPAGKKTKQIAGATGSKRVVGYQRFSPILAVDQKFQRGDGSWRADPDRPVYVNGKVYPIKSAYDLAATGTSTETLVDGTSSTVKWVKVEVEVRRHTTSKPVTKTVEFNFEQTATPPWFAECFLPHNIGQKFYQTMLGCGSVLDDNPLLTRTATEKAKERAQKEADRQYEAERTAAEEAGTDPPERDDLTVAPDTVTLQIPNGDGTVRESVIPGALLLPPRSTQLAADQLAGSWKLLTERGADLSLFIDSYVSRAYANFTDIMGDLNFDLKFRSGHQLRPRDPGRAGLVPGFHGNAYGNLTGLIGNDDVKMQFEPLATLTTGSATEGLRAVSGKVDPRAERRARVIDYVNELRDHH